MDANECETLIPAARGAAGKSTRQVLAEIEAAAAQFGANVKARMRRTGEWA
jgi:hypothetical protein